MKINKRKLIDKKVSTCKGCGLVQNPLKGHGSIPADVLVLVDAPVKANLIVKEALTGTDLKFFKVMMQDAIEETDVVLPLLKYYYLNSLLCRPHIMDKSDKDYGLQRIPFKREILSCLQHVLYIAKVVEPKIVIFCGNVAEQYYKSEFPDAVKISHPDYHLMYGGKNSPTYNMDVLNIVEALEEVYDD